MGAPPLHPDDVLVEKPPEPRLDGWRRIEEESPLFMREH